MADNVVINLGTSTSGTIATDDVSGVNYQVIKLDVGGDGSASPFTGTIADVTKITGGTISSVGTAVGIGTVTNLGSVTNLGTIKGIDTVAAVTSVAEIVAGTITGLSKGTISTGTVEVSAGTVASVGTVPGVGTLTNLGTLTNVGTVKGVDTVGTVPGIGTLTAIGAIHTAGTVAELPDLPGGTVDEVTLLKAGTVKLNATPAGSAILTTHVIGTGGGTFVGTILAPAGAGTSVYVTGLSIIGRSGTVDCGIANNVAGTTGAGVLARGFFDPGGGIARDFNPAINLGANGTIAYFLVTAGTVDLTVTYWVSP